MGKIKTIMCDTCPRCKDTYPGQVDYAGNRFYICGMSGCRVYKKPRKEPRDGGGYLYYNTSTCGLYESVEDVLKHMTQAEIEQWQKNNK